MPEPSSADTASVPSAPTKSRKRSVRLASGAAARRDRQLFYGDNFEVLQRHIKDESVDLIYLDPPFKSNQDYNVLFRDRSGQRSAAQMSAFEDTWTWDDHSEAAFQESLAQGGDIADALIALRHILRQSDMMAYIAMMAPRLRELHRVLKSSGSLYLHCDPTASHYLKIMLDAVFGGENFLSEIIWRRYGAHGNSTRYGAVHDSILFYGKTQSVTFNKQFVPYTEEYAASRFRLVDENGRRYQEQNLSNPGRRPNLHYPYTASNGVTYKPHPNGWKCDIDRMRQLDREGRLHFPKDPGGRLRLKMYLDESEGVPLQDVWTDVMLASSAPERLGYPTQKPLALLERIISASSNEGDVVLDPFCGCGTTIAAAERLRRRWIGIDIAYLAIDLIEKRMRATYGDAFAECFSATGAPRDKEGAHALFEANPIDFQVWAVSLIDGQPNERKSGDRGIDGRVLFPLAEKMKVGTAVVSVKGGGQINPAMVRELTGTVKTEAADLGVLILMGAPTRGMLDAAHSSGLYTWPVNGRTFPKIQIVSVDELLAGKRPNMPQALLPYIKARPDGGTQIELLQDQLPPKPGIVKVQPGHQSGEKTRKIKRQN